MLFLPLDEGGVLCFHQHHEDRLAVEEIGRRTSGRRRRRSVVRHGFRRFRRRLLAFQCRQFNRKHRKSTRSSERLGEEEFVGQPLWLPSGRRSAYPTTENFLLFLLPD